ncbi:MAG: hypothetical protein ACRDLL_13020 [Solirubrobacterales bacterium]
MISGGTSSGTTPAGSFEGIEGARSAASASPLLDVELPAELMQLVRAELERRHGPAPWPSSSARLQRAADAARLAIADLTGATDAELAAERGISPRTLQRRRELLHAALGSRP